MIRRWERFWFEEVPSEAFALVRIAVGVAGLISLFGSTPVAMFWPPDGIAPLPGDGIGLRMLVLESGFGVAVGWVLFLALFASFTCMTVGLFTGYAVIACFVGSVLQTRWNVLPLTSGHGVLLAALFCLVWADCGTRISIDERRRRRRHPDAASGPPTAPPRIDEGARQPIWPLRLIRAQVALIYLASGVFKLLGPHWRDGSAVHYTTGQNIYGRIFHVYPFPAGFDWVLTVLTYGTLLWELTFPLLLLNRITRRLALASGVAMHLGISATMEVGPFTLMMLATYVAFLDPHAIARTVATRLPVGRAPQTGRRLVAPAEP